MIDDIAIHAANNSLNSTISNLEVTTISTNLRHLGLEVSPNKSKFVIPNGKFNPPGSSPYGSVTTALPIKNPPISSASTLTES